MKKDACGLDDYDLGEVQEVNVSDFVTKKGIVDKDKFLLPKNLAERYDGNKVWFKISKEEAQTYRRD